jgi:hypothetical protein
VKDDDELFDRTERAIVSLSRWIMLLAALVTAAVLAAGFALLVHYGVL